MPACLPQRVEAFREETRLCWSLCKVIASLYPTTYENTPFYPCVYLCIPGQLRSRWSLQVPVLGVVHRNQQQAPCVILLYVSYAIPIVCLLIKARSNMDRQPF